MGVKARAAVLAVGVLEILVVYFHVLGIQQTRYWSWSFRNGWAWPMGPAIAAAALPMGLGVWLHLRHRSRPAVRLTWVAASVLLIQPIALVLAYHPADTALPGQLVRDRFTSSYWYDARQLLTEHVPMTTILRTYPQRLPSMYVHSRNKPPGFVMFYYGLQRLLGSTNGAAATMGALTIAVGTAAGVFGVYALGSELLGESDAAFWGAAVFALLPAVLGVFPQFDSCFAAVACLLLWLWLRILRAGGWVYEIALGMLVGGVLFCTSNVLVLGSLMLALVEWECRFGRPDAWRVAGRGVAFIGATVLAIYVALFLVSGYDPIATARAYAGIEFHFEQTVAHRPWPWIVPSDFFHFVFGTGRMVVLIGAGALLLPLPPRQRWAVRLCLLQIVFVGCTGLLRGETTRLWIFMMPLLAIPAGLELAHWPVRWRLAALGVLFLFAAVMLQNIEFNMRPVPG